MTYQAQAIALQRAAGEAQEAQESLSVLLYNHASYLAAAGQVEEAMRDALPQLLAGQAQQLTEAALAACREGRRAERATQLEELAARLAEGEAAGSPYDELAAYARALVAALRDEPAPPLPPPYVERYAAFAEALRGLG